MRKLVGNDLFKLSKILKKIDLDVKNIEVDGKNQQQIGIEIFKNLLENAHMAQEEINEFLGSLVGCSGKEFGEKSIIEYLSVINEIKSVPEIESFFKAVGQ